jgi:hypothetical protein
MFKGKRKPVWLQGWARKVTRDSDGEQWNINVLIDVEVSRHKESVCADVLVFLF